MKITLQNAWFFNEGFAVVKLDDKSGKLYPTGKIIWE
jgi:hypothetical protein